MQKKNHTAEGESDKNSFKFILNSIKVSIVTSQCIVIKHATGV